MIAPSGAAKETPSTAFTSPLAAEMLDQPVDRDHGAGPIRSGHSGGRRLPAR